MFNRADRPGLVGLPRVQFRVERRDRAGLQELAPEALPGTKRACGTQGTAALAALPAQVLTTTTTSRETMRLHRARRKKVRDVRFTS